MSIISGKTKIFIAVGEETDASDLDLRLKKIGCDVIGRAASSETAIEYLEKEQPDLIIIDTALEGRGDAIETAGIIRERWGMPLVFLISSADADLGERAQSVYPFGVLVKPFQDISLKVAIEMAFYGVRVNAGRRRAEEALRKSERILRHVLDAVPHHIHAKDMQGRFIMANKAVSESYNMTPDEFVGQYHMSVGMDEAEVRKMLADDMEVMLSGRSKYIPEETCIDASGQVHWLETTKTPFDNDGQPAVLVVAIDITERKKVQGKLKAYQQQMSLFMDVSPDIFFLKDGNLQYCFVNRAHSEVFNIPESEVLGFTDFHFMSMKQAENNKKTDLQVMREEKTVISIEPIGERVFETRKFPVSVDLKVIGVAGITRDITSRIKAAEELQKSEQRFRELFNSITDLIYVQDLEGRFLSINKAMQKLMGYEIDELTGRKASEFMKPEWAGFFEKDYIQVLKRDGIQDGISCYLSKNNDKVYIEYKSKLMFSENGEAYISGVGRDVTERILAERKRKQLETQLKQVQKLEAVGRLAGGVAHDFNNLLQAINGYVQVLLLNKEKNDQDYQNIEGIERCAARAAQLVRQLLLYSRKMETKRKPVGLNQELGHAILLLERTIPKMITIELDLENDLDPISADPVQIEQIILNMGSNAADAMPEGGKLTFKTQNMVLDEKQAQAHLEAAPGKYVLLVVTDTGCGMDQETVEHIFEPFYTTKEVGKGTGLGLASVYGVVKSHGGYMTCRSDPGKGSVFNIYFPSMEKAVRPSYEEIQKNPGIGGDELIMLVDDEESISEAVSEFLRNFGYDVVTASSGEEALNVYANSDRRIDLLILDLGMPGMGGHKCFREILKLDPAANVLIASGYSVDGKIKETLDAGAAGFLAKPYQLKDMLVKIRTILDK